MQRIISVDSPLYKFIVRFWDMVQLNFIWLIFSLPIITIGASTVAAYSVTLKMVDEHEGHIISQFITSFKENWKQGIVLGIISMLLGYFVYLNNEFFNKLESNPIWFLIAAIVIGFIGLMYMTYAFPLCARYHNNIIGTLRNSVAISMKYFLRTLLLWVILGLLLVIFFFNSTLMFIGLLIGPASLFLTVSGFANSFFKDIEKENKSLI